MEEFRMRILPTSTTKVVNMGTVLQSGNTPVENFTIVPIKEEKPSRLSDGPKMSEAYTRKRSSSSSGKLQEFFLSREVPTKKSWVGRSQDTNRYAILEFKNSEFNLQLVKHWYKFTPQIHIIQSPESNEFAKTQSEPPEETNSSKKRKRDTSENEEWSLDEEKSEDSEESQDEELVF